MSYPTAEATFVNVRVAGAPVFTPPYISATSKDGKPTQAKVEFTVFDNSRKNKRSDFRITAWGKAAETIARNVTTGKTFSFMRCTVESYQAKVWQPETNPNVKRKFYQLPDGTPLTQTKIGFTVKEFTFGKDGSTMELEEIAKWKTSGGAEGRPLCWNVRNTQDEKIWLAIRATKNDEQYVHGKPTFGYAKVKIPDGATVVNMNTTGTAQMQVANQGTFAMPVNQGSPNPQMVQQAAQPQPVYTQQPQAPQQVNNAPFIDQNGNVWVNGTCMGLPPVMSTQAITAPAQPNTNFQNGGFQPKSFSPPTQVRY